MLSACCAKWLQSYLTLCDPMGWALQAPLSMGFSRREYCVISVLLRYKEVSLADSAPYFGGAPVTLVRAAGSSPFLSPGCALSPWIWAYAAAKLEGISPLLLLLLSVYRFSFWLLTITWVTAWGPKLFSLCVLPSFPAHWCPRINEGARAAGLLSRLPGCPRRALCGEALGFCHHSHYFAK